MGGACSVYKRVIPESTYTFKLNALQRGLRVDAELEKRDYLRQVDNFVVMVYDAFPPALSLRVMLEADMARDSFEEYLKACYNALPTDLSTPSRQEGIINLVMRGNRSPKNKIRPFSPKKSTVETCPSILVDIEILKVYFDLCDILDTDDEAFIQQKSRLGDLVDTMLTTSTPSADVLKYLNSLIKPAEVEGKAEADPATDKEQTDAQIDQIVESIMAGSEVVDDEGLDRLQGICIEILGRKHFKGFLRSKFYAAWRKKESRHAVALTVRDAKPRKSLSLPVAPIDLKESTNESTLRTSLNANSPRMQLQLPGIVSSLIDSPENNVWSPSDSLKNPSRRSSVSNPRALPPLRPLSSFRGSMTNRASFKAPLPPLSRELSYQSNRNLSRSSSQFHITKKMSDLSLRAFSDIDDSELEKVLSGENWIAALLAAAEGLPIALSMCSAKTYSQGFPALYVNKAFETLTGYSRREVQGRNLKILQSPLDQEEFATNITSLSLHIGEKLPYTTVLSNTTKDGRRFKNLMALKPVLNDKDQYCYVIGIHGDVTEDLNDPQLRNEKVRLFNQLIDKLPYFILSDITDY